MPLFNTNQIDPTQLTGVSGRIVLASSGDKSLDVVVNFYYDSEMDEIESYLEFQLIHDGKSESHIMFEAAVERYNEL